ncbi:MAG TPA: amidase [Microbacteriaceae bacterium]|nr:amidase [Microbacteriaceae bacterium]
MAQLHDLTALELAAALKAGDTDPASAAEHYLARVDRLDGGLGAFVTVTAEAALERARHVRDRVPRTVPMWGVPFADKDLTRRAGVPARFGSRLMAAFVPATSDEIVETLDAAGGVSLGKTSTPEFGLPSYTEPLAGSPARNPWDPSLGAGGSSGGAAVAVAAGLLPVAPGSDGGGSIRIPAAACGLVGIKPSRGRVPAGSGLTSLAGLAVAGPIARTVADAAWLLDVMMRGAGRQPEHHYGVRAPGPEGPYRAAALADPPRLRIGVMTTSAWDDAYEIVVDPEALKVLGDTARSLDALGHDVAEVALTGSTDYAPAFRTVWQASAAAIPADPENELLEPLTRWLIGQGRALGARRLVDALAALKDYERSFIAQFAGYDAILTPALAMTPRPLGWYSDDPEQNFEQQCQYTPYTSMVNVAGLPAVVLPVGQSSEGLPLGVQLIGRPGGEESLVALGGQLERLIGWPRRHPPCW